MRSQNALVTRHQVTGTDLFFLALERASRRKSRIGYVCRIILTINGHLPSERLKAALSMNSLDVCLSSLSWSRKLPFTVPNWEIASGSRKTFSIREGTPDLKHSDDLFSRPSNLSALHPPAFDIELIYTPQNKTVLILSWHHGVMDARGGDLLLQTLGSDAPMNGDLLPSDNVRTPGIARLKIARRSVKTIAKQCKPPLARLIPSDENSGKYNFAYRILSFTEEETAKCLSIAAGSGAQFFTSLFFLAITVRGFDRVMKKRGVFTLPYVIPVGQDNRKKGANGPIILNQVNFLFFRVEPELTESIPQLISILRTQMENQIRESVPQEFGIVLNFFRHFPLWFVSRQIAGPSGGELASFYFSYQAGADFTKQEFLGFPIVDIVHIPPVAYPPGLSVAFSMYGKKLTLSLSFFAECMSNQELSIFEDSIRTDLGIVHDDANC
jgi:hypothetical protein